MKKRFALVMAVMMLITTLMPVSGVSAALEYDGSTVLIGTEAELFEFAELCNDIYEEYGEYGDFPNVRLTADITLTADEWVPFKFCNATFDGNGKKISEILINDFVEYEVEDYTELSAGFFALVRNAKVKNLTVSGNIEIYTEAADELTILAGGLAGDINSSHIENCNVLVDIAVESYDAEIGGLAGDCDDSTVSGCTVGFIGDEDTSSEPVEIEFYSYMESPEIGGLIGECDDNVIFDCTTNTYIYTDVQNTDCEIGGLVGDCDDTMIYGCRIINEITIINYSTGEDLYVQAGGICGELDGGEINCCEVFGSIYVNLEEISWNSIGGAVGNLEGSGTSICNTVVNCSIALSDADGYVGGIVGETNSYEEDGEETQLIVNCAASGDFYFYTSADCFGGIVGKLDSNSLVDNCAYTGEVYHKENVGCIGGIAGYAYGVVQNSYSNIEGEYGTNGEEYADLDELAGMLNDYIDDAKYSFELGSWIVEELDGEERLAIGDADINFIIKQPKTESPVVKVYDEENVTYQWQADSPVKPIAVSYDSAKWREESDDYYAYDSSSSSTFALRRAAGSGELVYTYEFTEDYNDIYIYFSYVESYTSGGEVKYELTRASDSTFKEEGSVPFSYSPYMEVFKNLPADTYTLTFKPTNDVTTTVVNVLAYEWQNLDGFDQNYLYHKLTGADSLYGRWVRCIVNGKLISHEFEYKTPIVVKADDMTVTVGDTVTPTFTVYTPENAVPPDVYEKFVSYASVECTVTTETAGVYEDALAASYDLDALNIDNGWDYISLVLIDGTLTVEEEEPVVPVPRPEGTIVITATDVEIEQGKKLDLTSPVEGLDYGVYLPDSIFYDPTMTDDEAAAFRAFVIGMLDVSLTSTVNTRKAGTFEGAIVPVVSEENAERIKTVYNADILCVAADLTVTEREEDFITPIMYFTVEAKAGDGGSITNEGIRFFPFGMPVTYRITADEGYEIADVIVNGESLGACETVTIDTPMAKNTVTAIFAPIDGSK